MDAIKLFKKQKKYEERERPVDRLQTTVIPAIIKELVTRSSVAVQSTTIVPVKRVVANKAHTYFYFPRRKETGAA